MSLEVAQTGHGAMSAMSPLLAQKQTLPTLIASALHHEAKGPEQDAGGGLLKVKPCHRHNGPSATNPGFAR